MRNSFIQAIKIFFSPETILPFMLGSIFLAVLGNAVYDILKNSLGSATPALVRIAIGSLLIFFASVGFVSWLVSKRLSRLSSGNSVLGNRRPQKHRGLILLVSNEEPCQQAIRYHLPKLQRCWLVCSAQTLPIAEKLRQEFPMVCQDTPVVINDIYDPLEFRIRINEIYLKRLPVTWAETDVIADYVGTTAHGSVGMVLAALGTDRPLQYTPAKLDPDTRKPIGCLDPIEIVLQPRSRKRELPLPQTPTIDSSRSQHHHKH
jgi:hypothetical protein